MMMMMMIREQRKPSIANLSRAPAAATPAPIEGYHQFIYILILFIEFQFYKIYILYLLIDFQFYKTNLKS